MNNNKSNAVILVNERDEWLGLADKMQAHKTGLLHRAFSVFVLNDKNEMLIQRRAEDKYHSPGLWSNACCSHPRAGESTMAAAHRRMQEELGIECVIEEIFTYRYKADVGNGLIENEYDHIYIGTSNSVPTLNPEEVSDYQYISIDKLSEWMQAEPESFTAWFRLLLPQLIKHLSEHSQAA